MDHEYYQKTERNSDDIQALTIQVVQIVEMCKHNEQRYGNIQEDVKSMTGGIKELNDKFSSVVSLTKDVARHAELIGETRNDTRVNRHDIDNLKQVVTQVTSLSTGHHEDIGKLKVKVEALETRNIRIDGAGAVIKFIWATGGVGILGVIGWVIVEYVRSRFSHG
jgi:hypothetical protein